MRDSCNVSRPKWAKSSRTPWRWPRLTTPAARSRRLTPRWSVRLRSRNATTPEDEATLVQLMRDHPDKAPEELSMMFAEMMHRRANGGAGGPPSGGAAAPMAGGMMPMAGGIGFFLFGIAPSPS